MASLFVGPFGLFLVIAQAAFFVCLMREMFVSIADDGAPTGVMAHPGRPRRSGWRFARDAGPRPAAMLEIYYDAENAAMTARILAGPFAGCGLDDLSEAALARQLEFCRAEDSLARDFLQAYLRRRNFGEQGERAGKAGRRQRAPFDEADEMTRERACEILGLRPWASDIEIHRAHRALIKQHHPDRGGSHARAAEINRAKDILMAAKEGWRMAA